MRLYRFSPITGEGQFLSAVRYVTRKNTLLCRKIIGKSLPISYVTIFSHFPDEYEKLKKICGRIGGQVSENNGPKFALGRTMKIAGHKITAIRIRKPDPYRTHVGCCDFDADFNKVRIFKSENLRVIKRPDMEMIEFFHPDFDVLAYVVNKSREEITF